MSSNQDFVIQNGILTQYNGPGGDVVIPEGVKKIGDWAFSRCKGLTSVIIPEGVMMIEDSAFFDCSGLTIVTIPEGVTMIGDWAFCNCKGLTSVTIPASVTEIGDSAFSGCKGLTEILVDTNNSVYRSEDGMLLKEECLLICPQDKTGSVTISEGVKEIRGGAFSGCKGLKKVDLPRSIRKIESGWGDDKLYKTMPDGLARTADKLSDGIAELIDKVWHRQMTTEDWAGLCLFQTSKAFQELFKKRMKAPADDCLSAMLELLADCKKPSAYVQAANYVVEHLKEISPEHIQALYEMTTAKKSFQKAADILKPLAAPKKEKKAVDPDSSFAFLEDTFQEAQLLKHYKEHKGMEKLLKPVKLADGEKAPALVILSAIVPYADQYKRPTQISSYKYDYIKVDIIKDADRAAELLDRASLLELLGELTKRHSSWYIPYCRYADGKRVTSLNSQMSSWASWYDHGPTGRSNIITVRGALMLSDTREAMLILDKGKYKDQFLGEYAKLRGTKAETLRDTVLVEFGLDEEGKKVYDLGGNTVTVTLAQDLTLSIFDANAGKAIKSIPKKDADLEKHKAAKADFEDMKKNVKKVVKARVDMLFARFLSGEAEGAKTWQKTYLNNPVLRQVASLLVWSQDGKTFTLRDGAAIDSGEQPYTISGKPIQVAHPMEMQPGDVAAWQKYFNNHGIKQPFAQVWEPVVHPETLREDCYSGIQLPVYRFKGKEKHGISFDFDYGLGALELSFSGCNLEYDSSGAASGHYLDMDGMVTLGRLTFQTYTRQVNHIVSLLDQWTIFGRIMRDDASIVTRLDSATLAQVIQYLDFAIENGRTNVTAELLNYKNEHFPDFDPLAEFTLDDL